MQSSTPGTSRVLGLLAAFVAASLVTGALVAGLFIPAVGATAVVTRSGVDYFNSLPADLSTPPLAEQSTMYAADGKYPIARFYDENRISVPLSRIAPVMRQAIIAIEDARFYDHGGVDPKGVMRAFLNNQMSGATQGASTLTQQYIKNYNVEKAVAAGDRQGASDATSQSYSRKLREMRTAIALEKKLSKDQILEGYLNIALFGDNTWGVEAAAQYYFSTTAAKLSLVQAATLAGLVQSPVTYSPLRHPVEATKRRNEVLTRMLQLGMITPKAYADAKASKLTTKKKNSQNGCITAKDAAYYCAYVINTLKTDPAYAFLGKTPDERLTNIRRGGYSITTNLDPRIQGHAARSVVAHVPIGDRSNVAAAAVTVEPGTGKVLALAQNLVYNPDGARSHTELNYAVDKSLGESQGFATGSTFKPFTLATYLSQGKSLNDTVDASQTRRPMRDFTACGSRLSGSEDYTFHNAGDGEMSGAMPVQEATYRSVNTAYVDIESRVDMCDLVNTASKIGVHLASTPSAFCDDSYKKTPLRLPYCYPSMTLGPMSISPLTMAAAYAAFAADGKYCEPRPVAAIKDRTGRPQAVPGQKCSRGLTSEVAHGVTYALKKVLTIGTAAGKGIGVPAGGKTGTSDMSGNTWFVGYTRSLSTAVWVADPHSYEDSPLESHQRPLRGITINGKPYRNVYGATIAGAIWQQYMRNAMKGRQAGDWPDPPPSMLKGSGKRMPNLTGQPVPQAKAFLESQGYRVEVSGPVGGPAPAGSVARTSPPAGSLVADGATVILYVSDGSQGVPIPGPGNGDNPGNGNGNGRGRGGGQFPLPTVIP